MGTANAMKVNMKTLKRMYKYLHPVIEIVTSQLPGDKFPT